MKASELFVLSVVGAFFLIMGRKTPKDENGENERVDVNEVTDAETGNKGTISWRGSPVSVVKFRSTYNIGEVRGGMFYAEKGNASKRTTFSDLSSAIATAKRRNDPEGGGVQKAPEGAQKKEPSLIPPTIVPDYGFGNAPSMGW